MPPRAALRRLSETARRAVDGPLGTVGFAFVDDREMRRHHGRFKGDVATTDVLSFPADREEDDGYWGDVILCTDQAVRQARERGHPYPYELGLLALHGVLHLLGYDHARDDGTMRRLEERLRPLAVAEEVT